MENMTNEMINNEVTENVIEEAVEVASKSKNGMVVLAGVIIGGAILAGGTALYKICKGKKKTYANVDKEEVTETTDELAEEPEEI